MPKFLLDENISHETAKYLQELGYRAETVAQLGYDRTDDLDIVRYATENDYILITFDLDFGYIFRVLKQTSVGIVILRLRDQTVESANAAIKRLIDSKNLEDPKNQKGLIIIDEARIRIRE